MKRRDTLGFKVLGGKSGCSIGCKAKRLVVQGG